MEEQRVEEQMCFACCPHCKHVLSCEYTRREKNDT